MVSLEDYIEVMVKGNSFNLINALHLASGCRDQELLDKFNKYLIKYLQTVDLKGKMQEKVLRYDFKVFAEGVTHPCYYIQGIVMRSFSDEKIKKFLRGTRWKSWSRLHEEVINYLIENGRMSKRGI